MSQPAEMPVFIIAPPRSFTSVACAMLGQHPQLYGLCELHLFIATSVYNWFRLSTAASFSMRDGLLRAIAEVCFGAQTDDSVGRARRWLLARADYTSGMILDEIAAMVQPRILVEKSPSNVYRLEYLRRAFSMYPKARFIHLTRHPVGQGESVMKVVRKVEAYGPLPYWLMNLASYPYWPPRENEQQEALASTDLPEVSRRATVFDIDPQRAWYHLNSTICEFLKAVPDGQKLRVRGEDLFTSTDRTLSRIAEWLDIKTDSETIEEMKHPERSPYACFGPRSAPVGFDSDFLENPVLRPERAKPLSFSQEISWFSNARGGGLSSEVKDMAREFGYT